VRILICAFSFYPSVNGVANVVYEHAKNFIKEGHAVTVATQADISRVDKSFENINIVEFDIRGGPLLTNFYRGEIRDYLDFLNSAYFNYDVIFFHGWQIWSTDLFLFSKSKSVTSAKTIFVSHCSPSMRWRSGFEIIRTLLLLPYVWFVMPRLMRKFDQLVFLSSKKSGDRHQDYKKASIICPAKINVIPNGLPSVLPVAEGSFNCSEMKGLTKDKKIILYVANYDKSKDQLRTIKVFEKLNNLSNAHLVLIGSSCNRYCKRLIAYVHHKKLTGKVSILFERERSEVLALYAASYMTLFTSRTECCPLAVLESLAFRKPVISTDVGCLTEYSGVLVSSSDSGLVRNADLLLGDEQYYRKTQTAIDESKELMSWATVMEGYARLLEVVYED